MIALVALTVAQRKRELGIRMAIGAGVRHILDVHLRQSAKPAAAGAVVGVILAVTLSMLVRSQIVLQKQDTVEVLDFAAGPACFALVAPWRLCRQPGARCASILPRRVAGIPAAAPKRTEPTGSLHKPTPDALLDRD